jgi:hypothetical protein
MAISQSCGYIFPLADGLQGVVNLKAAREFQSEHWAQASDVSRQQRARTGVDQDCPAHR